VNTQELSRELHSELCSCLQSFYTAGVALLLRKWYKLKKTFDKYSNFKIISPLSAEEEALKSNPRPIFIRVF